MPLTYMVSLALMLLLMASVIHFVALVTPAWVQFGIFVPVITRRPTSTPANSTGHGEAGTSNDSVPMDVDGGGGNSEFIIGDGGAPRFVKVQLGLWEWCQEFQDMSPDCQEPGFLGGVAVLALVALVIIPLSFVLLVYSVCCLDVLDNRKNRLIHVVSLVASVASGFTIILAVTIYAVLTRREVTRMLTVIGENPDLSYLGWAFGADAMAGVLVLLATLFICVQLRRHTPKSTLQFQPVA